MAQVEKAEASADWLFAGVGARTGDGSPFYLFRNTFFKVVITSLRRAEGRKTRRWQSDMHCHEHSYINSTSLIQGCTNRPKNV